MRKIFLIIILIFLFQTGCYPQDIIKTETKEAEDQYRWNFGKVKEGEILKHDFILKNESDKILNIKEVTTSCGCTVSEVKKKKVLPGEITSIEVKFNTKGYSGLVQQFIYVHTDDLDTSTRLSVNSERNRTIDKPILKFIIKAEVVK